MGWREQVGRAFESLFGVPWAGGWTAVLAACVLALVVMLPPFARLLRQKADAPTGDAEAKRTAMDQPAPDALDTDEVYDLTPEPVDRMLPLGRTGFLVLVIGVAAGSWLLGLALARNTAGFLASHEWHFQPFYIAAHLVTLRLFVAVFTRNFRVGITKLDVPAKIALAGMHRILGSRGALVAGLVAVPFCISEFRNLTGPSYTRLDPQSPLGGIDYLIWGIWCFEWFLNAFIWVILVGFLVHNVRTLRTYQFRSPIEVVLVEKQYRPFLRMSSQAATVVLGFALMTVLYIGYTGGAITDYLGLAITAVLLVVGFVWPWLLLRRKVHQAVVAEQRRLQRALSGGDAIGTLAGAPASSSGSDPQALAARLDYVVSLLRIDYLERLHSGLGTTEARAVAIRLLAPAATIGWQFSQNYRPVMDQASRILHDVLSRLMALGG